MDMGETIGVRGEEKYLLMHEECMFLAFAIGTLRVFSSPSKTTELSVKTLWNTLTDLNTYSSLDDPQSFHVRYAVYHYYRSNGWVVRSGVLFGTDFVLYKKGGPAKKHSDYAVWIVPKNHKVTWKTVLSKSRCCSQAKKVRLD